jgi:hypothetical protein
MVAHGTFRRKSDSDEFAAEATNAGSQPTAAGSQLRSSERDRKVGANSLYTEALIGSVAPTPACVFLQ